MNDNNEIKYSLARASVLYYLNLVVYKRLFLPTPIILIIFFQILINMFLLSVLSPQKLTVYVVMKWK